MQVYKDTTSYQHSASSYTMAFSQSSSSPSHHSQYPYNPYPHKDQCSQKPMYTLRDHTSPEVSIVSNRDSLDPPQDMLSTLEKLLMDISPFPPTMPTLAKPTCPMLDERSMNDQSTLVLPKPSAPYRESIAEKTSFSLQQEQQQQHNHNTSPRTIPVMNSPASASPLAKESCPGRPTPYWSPPASNAQLDHDWNNRSSPMPSISHGSSSSASSPQVQSPSWGSLFDLDTYMTPSDGDSSRRQPQQQQQHHHHHHHHNHHHHSHSQQQQQPQRPIPTLAPAPTLIPTQTPIVRRAARTPLQHRSSSDLFGLRIYRPTAHSHYAAASSSPSSALSTSHSSTNGSHSDTSSNSHSGNNTNTRSPGGSSGGSGGGGGFKSYPCPTCSKPFPTRTQLKSHMAIHVDNFPFPCLYAGCDLHFKRKHDLRRHIDAKHALVKKYLCSGGCGEGFGRRDQMIRHLQRGTCGQGFRS
ncbi:hypothetical protein B0O80DRAFT_448260 [Mortierella sp. GBAus27b]|nr:hypothetical protein B0O80DRAFT_448260 [Mortierella sp. GBAus27b]